MITGNMIEGIISGTPLGAQHQASQDRHLPHAGSAAYNALSPEQQEAVERERERRERVGRQQRADYIESVGGYGNYEGGFNDSDYWNAGHPTMEGAFWYGGAAHDGSYDPSGGYDYAAGQGAGIEGFPAGGGLGAGHGQNPNPVFGGGGNTGGGHGPSPIPGGGGSGGGSTGGGTQPPSSNVSSSTPFLDSYLRAREMSTKKGPVSETMSDYI